MAENFREFQPGNSSENGRGTQRENNKNNSAYQTSGSNAGVAKG